MMPDSALAPAVAHELVAVQPVPADRHPAAVYLASLAPGSRRTMRQALDAVAGILTRGQATAATLEWTALRYPHTQLVRSALAARYAPATANKMLAALRGVLREAWRLGYVTAEDYHRAADLPAVRGSTLPRGRALTAGELRALFAAVAEDARPATRARDAALLAVLYGAGVRRAEAVALDVADYEPELGILTIRRGKGNKARVMYATNGVRDALAAWLTVRGTEPGPLFVPVGKAGRIVLRRLTPESVFDRLQALAKRAGISRFSPHDMRRSFISDLLDNGADLSVVQAMAGHANPATTARYDRRGERAKQRAAGLLVVPYVAS
jgi:site-specific recombinase XerD